MGFAPADLGAVPILGLPDRQLRLGPFGSGRDVVVFLGFAIIGATVAAVTSAVAWIPFLAGGVTVAFARVDGRTLDDYVLGYCRFRWRASNPSVGGQGASPRTPRTPGPSPRSLPSIRAGGISIAYLPPAELHRLFDEWRSILSALDCSLGCRMRGEPFSVLPFLPAPDRASGPESGVLASYRELVQLLLRNRSRRVVDIALWSDGSDGDPLSIRLDAQLDELVAALERLGISCRRTPMGAGRPGTAGRGFP